MKQWLVISFALVLLAACRAPAAPPATDAPSPATQSKTISIGAHRGGAGLAPENTLAAFRNGIALGADYIEMDVHLTKDGVPVVIHDPTIDRTTDGTGRVADLTLAQLQSFNAAAKFAGATERQVVPTLAQVLDLAKPTSVQLEIEIKVNADNQPYAGIEQKVIDEIAARGMLDRVHLTSLKLDTLPRVRAIDPKIKTTALLSSSYFRSHDLLQPAAVIDDVASFANGIGVDQSYLTPQLVREAHQRNMSVNVWTVDSEAEMNKFIAMGVDSITTNRPDVLKRVLGRQ
jgi:glycerophosphoryl diester phosphodiesterase